MRAAATTLGLALVVAACGTIAESNGGDENLPSRGIIPFDPLVDDEGELIPVLLDEERDLSQPSALELDDGVTLFVTAREDEQTTIRRAFAPDGVAFGDTVEVLPPEQIWEGRSVESPSALQVDGQVWLWYLGGERGGRFDAVVGLARSSDGGLTFEREPPPVLFPEPDERFRAPSVVRVDDGFAMFVAIEPLEPEDDPPPSQIVRFDSDDGVIWDRVGAVLEAGTGCLNNDGEPTACWDSGYVTEPGARASRSPAGRTLVDLWYTGGIGDNVGIGFAGSYDGLTFSRYRLNPIVDLGRAQSASVVALGRNPRLYFSDDSGAIHVALRSPP